MVERYVEALQEAAWKPHVLKRRLRLFELRATGFPMAEVKRILDTELGKKRVTERQLYFDWREIRKVIAAAAAPELEEIKALSEARLERIYTLAMAGHGKHGIPALSEARRCVIDRLTLHGLYKQGGDIVVNAPGAAEAEQLRGKSDEDLAALAVKEAEQLAEVLTGMNGNGHHEKG